jgi:tetrapyrrole methylase family protein / MazG family protein
LSKVTGRRKVDIPRQKKFCGRPMRSPTKKSSKPKKKTSARSTPARKSARANSSSAGEWFEKLVAVQKRLRASQGCPWDREQTHATLRPYLIEEAYEVIDALDSGDDAKFAEEMGDLLLQVVFHSEIAREQERFSVADVVREIHDKMVRRHPHVFGDVRARNSAEVLQNWERIKATERLDKDASSKNGASKPQQKPASLLDGVSRGLPAMLQGLQLTRKAARAGFDWHDADGIFEKLREEMAEVRHALVEKDSKKAEEELGDLLFAAINLARFVQVDPEIALKKANAKFQRRFMEMEKAALQSGRTFDGLPREDKESLWDAVKHSEKKSVDARKSANGESQSAKPQTSRMSASNGR